MTRREKTESLVVPREHRANPYPYYARLRATDPVHRSDSGFWVLTRYQDVSRVLRDPRYGPVARRPEEALDSEVWPDGRDWVRVLERRCRRSQEVRAATVGLAQLWLNNLEPPLHTVLRRALSPSLTAAAVEHWRPRIRAICGRLLDGAAGESCIDVVALLAAPLPALVIAEMLGVPEADRAPLIAWTRALGPALAGDVRPATLDRASAATLGLAAYFDRWARGHAGAGSEIFRGLLNEAERHGQSGVREAVAQCLALIFAGQETTAHLIANGLLALLSHQDQLRRLKEDLPAALPCAVEEILRYDSPVQFTLRVAREEMGIGGRRIAAGDRLVATIGAANRDPQKFCLPDRFDIRRRPNPHLAFGAGIHGCLGAALARAEGEIAIETLLGRYPELALATRRPEWKEGGLLRGPAALWVRTGAPRG